VEAGNRRSAQYNYLRPGEYRFQVRAANGDGQWNWTGDAVTLVVEPHFYETWWCQLLAGLLVIGGVSGVIRHRATLRLRREMERMERQHELERERTRIAKDIHDDLGASLTLIAVLGDLAKKEKTGDRIEKMSGLAREAVKSLDEIVWAVNPRNDTLEHLIDYAGQFAMAYLREAGVRSGLDWPEQAPARSLPANVRHNLFLAIKEALQNIVKHAGASEAGLRITAAATGLRVVVEDNGRGFDRPPADDQADGLRNLRQRLAEIGGECRIASQPGAGTVVTMDYPWPADPAN
jgi:signal transduction histidine kinase